MYEGLLEAYNAFIVHTRAKLSSLKPSSREWWKISRSLMSLGGSAEVIPPLKDSDGNWATTASEKANLLADIFEKKSRLDDEIANEFSAVGTSTEVSRRRFHSHSAALREAGAVATGHSQRYRA